MTQTQKSLLIIVFSPLFSTNPSQSESLALAPVHSWRDVQSLLTFIYVEAAREAQRIDNILLNVDVVLQDPAPAALDANIKQRYGADNWEAVFALDGGTSLVDLLLSNAFVCQHAHRPLQTI